MKALFSKITKRIKMTFVKFKTDCNFSVRYAFLRIKDELGGRIGFKKISKKAHDKKDVWISKYLKNNLSNVIQQYKNDTDLGTNDNNSPIWICWWTGEDTAPTIVKQCIKSIKSNSGSRTVKFIDKNSYSKYISVPDYMLKKAECGDMCLAHLCDYIRIALIEKYGGLWLDSTIFCADVVPAEYFNIPFFTCKSEYQPDFHYLSKLRWTTFVLGGWKGNLFYRFLKSMLEEYWKKEKYAIDYLFFDHLIELAYNEIPAIRKLIDDVPINNLHRDDLQAAMNDALPASEFDNILQSDTVLYKLSWRETYALSTFDGTDSVYAYFLKLKM